jgi:hypothetical protein
MSDKKQAELDILGETHLPADLLTPTLGSNYGLDGYPDMEYGMGVLEGILDPELTESPALPTGLSKNGADEDGMDLSAMMNEESMADLDWLDPTQLQDPERLPETPVSIPELEEAWGVNRRTDGVVVFARDLTRARYEESLGAPAAPKKAKTSSLVKVVQRAMQRSAAGHDLDALLKEAVLHLGKNLKEASGALLIVKDEHGLAGNVFIRAAAYPGYAQGKHRELAKTAARYVIVDEKTLKTATWIQDGRCVYTKKVAVTEVPWDEALRVYRPRLAGRIASEGDPRELLKAAFLTNPNKEAAEGDPGYLPTHDPSVRAGFLAEGGGERKVYDKQASRIEEGVRKVTAAIERGTYGDILRTLIKRTFRAEDMNAAVKRLTPLLVKTGALDRKAAEETPYSGYEFQAHALNKAASLGDPNARVLSKVASGALRWIRQSMAEGFAGRDLTNLIRNRFADSLLSEIEEPLRELRAAHEGGSGFLYVDAVAYASAAGVKGCETGALKHRANQIPAVASMDRCANCTLVRKLSDGTRKCAVYNKALLDDTTGPDIERVKKANIRVANMSDAEQTAAIFMTPQNAYDPTEYTLRNANLEEIEVEYPEDEKMADITFGGWDL